MLCPVEGEGGRQAKAKEDDAPLETSLSPRGRMVSIVDDQMPKKSQLSRTRSRRPSPPLLSFDRHFKMGHGTRRPAAQDGRRRWCGVRARRAGLVVSYWTCSEGGVACVSCIVGTIHQGEGVRATYRGVAGSSLSAKFLESSYNCFLRMAGRHIRVRSVDE